MLLDHGVPWLENESGAQAFLRYAHDKLDRSKSARHPRGCFPELRLMAAVCAWCEVDEDARQYAQLARELWEEERARLAAARRVYAQRHPDRGTALAGVPDLLGELERLTSPTRVASVFSAEAAARERRSKSGSSAPSRAGRS